MLSICDTLAHVIDVSDGVLVVAAFVEETVCNEIGIDVVCAGEVMGEVDSDCVVVGMEVSVYVG